MTLNADSRVLMCPYCGSAELIVESDDVTKERIRGQIATQGYHVYRDVEVSRHAAFVEGKRADAQKQKYSSLEKNGEHLMGIVLIAVCAVIVLVCLGVLSSFA